MGLARFFFPPMEDDLREKEKKPRALTNHFSRDFSQLSHFWRHFFPYNFSSSLFVQCFHFSNFESCHGLYFIEINRVLWSNMLFFYLQNPEILQKSRAGHFRYFFIFSIIKNYFFALFIKLITYFCTSPI